MKKLLKMLLILNVAVFLQACSDDDDDGGGEGDGNIRLQYKIEETINGNYCTTGQHVFVAKTRPAAMELYCAGLINEIGNNHCARATRERRFEDECQNTDVARNRYNPGPNDQGDRFEEPDQRGPRRGGNDPADRGDLREREAKRTFKMTDFAGETLFSRGNFALTVTVKNKQKGTSRTQQVLCQLRSPMAIYATYPNLTFQSGIIKCEPLRNETLKMPMKNVLRLIEGLDFKLRQPMGSPVYQYLMNLERVHSPNFYLPPHMKIDELKSMNANIQHRRAYMSVYLLAKPIQFGMEEPRSYFVEPQLEFIGNNLAIFTVNATVTSEKREIEFKFNGQVGK